MSDKGAGGRCDASFAPPTCSVTYNIFFINPHIQLNFIPLTNLNYLESVHLRG